jgi:hypothetical protein
VSEYPIHRDGYQVTDPENLRRMQEFAEPRVVGARVVRRTYLPGLDGEMIETTSFPSAARRVRELHEHLSRPTHRVCWEEGRKAQEEGRSLVDSPYRHETPEDTAWLHGFAKLPCPR